MTPKRKALLAAGCAGTAYAALCAFLWAAQDRLIFKGARKLPKEPALRSDVRAGEFTASDGARLAVFEIGDPDSDRAILALPGNSGDSVRYLRYLHAEIRKRLPGAPPVKIVSFHYRGYGATAGRPNGPRILADAMEFAQAQNVRSVFGRSLGAGIGAAVAGKLGLPAVLIAPWDELALVAKDHAKSLLPAFVVRKLLRHNISNSPDSLGAAPLSAVLFEDDSVVRTRRTETLFNDWPGPKELIRAKGTHDARYHLSAAQCALLAGPDA